MKHRTTDTLISLLLLVGLLPFPLRAEQPARAAHPPLNSGASPATPSHANTLQLDGAGDYLRIADHVELNPSTEISIEAWVNPDSITGCQTVLGKDYTAAYWLGLCGGRIRFYPHGSGSSVDGVAALPAGVWSHIAVTYDGVTRRYYINGELDLQSSANPGAPSGSSADLAIGADLNGGLLYEFDGRIDEVRLWLRTLSAEEIQANLYGDTMVGGEGSALVGYWRLDGGGSDNAYDGANNYGLPQGNAGYANSGVEPDQMTAVQKASGSVTLDGVCNPSEYAGAYEYTTGFSSTFFIHNVDNVYVCFPSLEKSAGRWASVALDMDFNRSTAPDSQDYLFTIGVDGAASAQVGNGSGWAVFTPPAGFWQVAYWNDPGNEFTWSAEFRFPTSSFGWLPAYGGATFGVAFFEGRSGLRSTAFPGGAGENLPLSWGGGSNTPYVVPSVTWDFSGTVLDEQSAAGIPNAAVQLLQSTSGGTFLLETTTSDANGAFSFSHSGLAGGLFLVQVQDVVGYTSLRATTGSDGRVISPNLVSFLATVGGGAYSPVTFFDTQNLPERRAFDRHYIIVYSSPVVYGDLWPLIEMKKLQGYQVEAISVSEITAQTAGFDVAEKIRNHLKARWQALDPHPVYALLVGRHDLIPVRDLGWLGDADHRIPGEDNYAPAVVTDWYYADLDSDWDSDGDHFYGEYLYCDPALYIVPLAGADLPGRCPDASSPLREGPYGASPDASDDWVPEISLGRLLINDRAEVRIALETSARSESSGSLVKQDALLAGSMWSFNGRSWNAASGSYTNGSGPNIIGAWPNPPARPFGDDAAVNLEATLKPALSDSMDQITTLYETFTPYPELNLFPAQFDPTDLLTSDTMNDAIASGYGLVNANGHGSARGVYRIAWFADRNNNQQVDNPANPAEVPGGCTGSCSELTTPLFLSADTSAPPLPVAPVIFANACSTGAWYRENWVGGVKVFEADPTAAAGRAPAQGKAAAWIGALNIVPVHGLDGQQSTFSQDIIQKPLLLGDAFWKGMQTVHDVAQWDWRMHTQMLFGDPAYAYWGNPLDANAAWPQSGQNWFGSGATLTAGPASGVVVWATAAGAPLSPPVVDGEGRIIAGGPAQITRFSLDGSVADTASPGGSVSFSPAVGVDGVYVASGSALYAYDPALNLRRAISLGGQANGEPRIGPDGIVWLPTSLGMARVTGSLVTEILDGGAALTPAALTLSGAAVWAGTGSTLHGYFMDRNGEITRDTLTISGAGTLTAPVVAPNGDIYVGGSNSILYRIPGGFPFPASAAVALDAAGPIVARPVIGDDGSVYVGTQDGSLYGLDPDGAIRWQKTLPGAILAAPALDPNRLYVVFGSVLRVYEPGSGGYLWSLALGEASGAQSSVVIGEGQRLYITTSSGKLIAVGEHLRLNLPANVRLTPGVANLTLYWDDTSANETGFRVEVCLLTNTCQVFGQTPANSTQLTISQVPVGEAVRFRVQAVGSFNGDSPSDAPGYSSGYAYSAYTSVPPPAPSAPINLTAEALSAEGILAAWDYSGANASLLTGFRVYRSDSPGGPFVEVAAVSASSSSFADSGLQAGTTYFYQVAAETAGGLSTQSATASAQTRQQTLAAPENLAAVQQDDLSVLLTWQDAASGESGYMVERRLPAVGEFVLTALLPANATSYSDPAALLAEGGVEYRVRAFSTTSESLPANVVVIYALPRVYEVFLPLALR